MSQTLRFRSAIEAARGGGAVARIPPDVTEALGGLKQMRITGTVNGVARPPLSPGAGTPVVWPPGRRSAGGRGTNRP
jgi:hypothetical protein